MEYQKSTQVRQNMMLALCMMILIDWYDAEISLILFRHQLCSDTQSTASA